MARGLKKIREILVSAAITGREGLFSIFWRRTGVWSGLRPASEVFHSGEYVDVAVRRRESPHEINMYVVKMHLWLGSLADGTKMEFFLLAPEAGMRPPKYAMFNVVPQKTFGH